jgi:hypothetical protein
MKARNVTYAALAGAVALVFAAAPASAQVCAGMPTAPGQTSIGARASFPTVGTVLGIEASRNWNNPLGVFVNLNLLMPDADDADNTTLIGAGLAYEVGGFIPAVPAWLSVCPVAAVTLDLGGDATGFTIPLGVGFGTRFAANGFEILPFVIPQFVLTRFSVEGVNFDDQNFGIGFGGFAKFSGVYGGVTLNRIFVDGASTDIAFQGGLVFPARLP